MYVAYRRNSNHFGNAVKRELNRVLLERSPETSIFSIVVKAFRIVVEFSCYCRALFFYYYKFRSISEYHTLTAPGPIIITITGARGNNSASTVRLINFSFVLTLRPVGRANG